MQTAFYTDGKYLLAPTDKKVILRGINKRSVQDESDPKGDTSFAEIRKTGANSARIVWAITKDLKTGGPHRPGDPRRPHHQRLEEPAHPHDRVA